jgi:GntR family transcriptional repressor for pyruvate dehydrogenase complex
VELTRQLLDYLLSGELRPGQRIPSERQLARALSVGRSAVRDALRPLTALGLLDVRIGDGTYLNDPDSELLPKLIEWGMLLRERRVLDLIEARRHLEVVTARLAAERRRPEDVEGLRRLLADIAAAATPEAFSRADTAFHLRVAEIGGNTVLSGMLHGFQSLLRVWIHRVLDVQREFELSYREHVPVLDAIAAGDADAAGAAMAAHLDSATRRLQATFEGRDER